MTWQPPPLKLDEDDVENALDAMLSGHALGDHPLKQFVSVLIRLQRPGTLAGDSSLEIAVFDHLSDVIVKHLAHLREQYGLPSPDGACTDGNIEADFRPGDPILEAWSMLYHRYVCSERSALLREFTEQGIPHARTLRRRHRSGIAFLTRVLVRLEHEVFHQERSRKLRLAIPPVARDTLVGIDDQVATVFHLLTDAEPPCHLVLHGPPGIGKTTLAQVAAHATVEDARFDAVLWLTLGERAFDLESLVGEVMSGLHLLPGRESSPGQALKAYLSSHQTLIVLDQAESLLSDGALSERCLEVLNSASVLITSRVQASDRLWVSQISLPGLDRETAFLFLERLAEQRPSIRRDWVDHFDTFWGTVGGNPDALRRVVTTSHKLPPGEAAAWTSDRLYRLTWQDLTPAERRVWLVALLFPSRGLPFEAIHALTDLDRSAARHACERLVDRALLDPQPVGETIVYTMQPSAATFLSEHAGQSLAVSEHELAMDFFHQALRRQVHHVAHHAQAGQAIRLLRLAARLRFSHAERWEFTHSLADQITQANLWQPWLEQLELLLEGERAPEQQAWLLHAMGVALRWTGQLDRANVYLERALTLRESATPDRADTLIELAVVFRYLGRYHEAKQSAGEARQHYDAANMVEGANRCVHELAQLALEIDRYQNALGWVAQLDTWTARTWGLAGEAYFRLDQFDDALKAIDQSLRLLPVHHPHQGRLRVTLGRIFDAQGEPDRAVEYLLQAMRLLDESKDIIGYARACNNLAVAYSHQPEDQRAVPKSEICRLLHQALEIQTHIGDAIGRMVTEQNLSWLSCNTDGPRDG